MLPFIIIILATTIRCSTINNEPDGFDQHLFRTQDSPGRYSSQLIDRCIATYSHGRFLNGREFLRSLTVNLPALIPTKLYEYHADVDYFMIKQSNLPQPGARVRLWTTSSNDEDDDSNDLLVDLLFGCEGLRYYHHQISSIQLSDVDLRRNAADCIPIVTIEHVRITGNSLRSQGFTSTLLLNLINTLDSIRQHSQLPRPPRIMAEALTRTDLGYTGAAFWAKRGFQFHDENERRRFIDSFITWLVQSKQLSAPSVQATRNYLMLTIKQPSDMITVDLNHVIITGRKDIGINFLRTAQQASWQGHLIVGDETARVTADKLSQQIQSKRMGRNKPLASAIRQPVRPPIASVRNNKMTAFRVAI
jgi:hypothetical protein